MARKNRGFVKGTIIGALVGVVGGLLFAPKSGKETQEDLKRRAKMVKDDLEQVLVDLSGEMHGRIDNLKEAARDLGDEAREESQALVRRAETMKQDLQQSAAKLSKLGSDAKGQTIDDAKRLVKEGSEVLDELERVTRKLAGSAKDKVKDSARKPEDKKED